MFKLGRVTFFFNSVIFLYSMSFERLILYRLILRVSCILIIV